MNRVVFSSQADHWATPSAVFDGLNKEFNFDFDPCPLKSTEDGTKIKWRGNAFCNPPYSKIGEFIRGGLYYLSTGDCAVAVYLLPARTDTAWFHEFCLRAAEIRFIKGRLRFGAAKNSAPFPSMIVVFREWVISPTNISL